MKTKKIFDIKEPMDRKDMNWAQAKWANPRLRPTGDWDNDGIKNQFDCKPMNRKRQDTATVVDTKTGEVVGEYSSKKRARNKADKLDDEYGAYRYVAR